MSRKSTAQNPVHETTLGNEIGKAVALCVPPLQKGLWTSYTLETGDFILKARWTADCEKVRIVVEFKP